MEEREPQQREREAELPEHETRPEVGTGAGLTGSGISAEQHDLPDGELPDEDVPDEPALEPHERPIAYRHPSGG